MVECLPLGRWAPQDHVKCDMCSDRTSVGKPPMSATVCPSRALFFGTREQIEQLRPAEAQTPQ
jgi:Fe-S-cluster-containing dehydrogenase component